MSAASETPEPATSNSELLQEVQRLRRLLNAQPQIVWEADSLGNVTFLSERWLELTGLTQEEALGSGWVKVPHPDDLPLVLDAWSKAISTGEPYDIEHRMRLASGEHRWVRARANPQRDSSGCILAWHATTEDVHDRKIAQDALRESEERHRATFGGAAVGIAQVGLDGTLIEFNEATCRILGYSPDELWELGVNGTSHPDDLREDWQQAHRLISGEIPHYTIEKRLIRKDGGIVWVNLSVSAVRSAAGKALYLVSVFQDITARKEAEEEQARTEARLGQFMESVGDLVMILDHDWSIVGFNTAAEKYGGLPRDEVIGRSYWEVYPTTLGTIFEQEYRRAVEQKVPVAFETRSTHLDKWVDVRAYPHDGGLAILATDVTERRQAERMLQATTDSVPVLVAYLDADLTYCFVNAAYESFYRCSRYEIIGKKLPDFIGTKAFASAQPYLRRALEGESVSYMTWLDYPHIGPRYMQVEYRPSVDDGVVNGLYSLVVDQTEHEMADQELERLNIELELRVEERTAELSRANRDLNEFAYSVAHDLRAPLRAIVSTSRILLDDAGDRLTPDERETLQRQAKNGVRLAAIVDDLLGFARLANAELKKREFDFTSVARSTAEEVSKRYQGCVIEVQDDLRAVGEPTLIGYALTNLLDNACKFSPSGGVVEVGESDGTYHVRDRGVGFDMEHAHKLFVAFERLVDQETFQGTGVGLANVKRIVERHGGRVWAEGKPGNGATFYFTLG